ncbi:DUF2169 domain-containing protein [Bordetella tumbae]
MKIIKPLRMMVMPRPYRWRNGKYLAVTLAVLIKHEGDRPLIEPEYTLIHDILPELDSDEVLDFVMPKPHPEYLVSGNAYTAHQEDQTHCVVRVRVGTKEKDGLVFGDRYWLGDTISDPVPFECQSLSWANSFGGPSFPDNPRGTGLDAVDVQGNQVIRLPNLESLTDRVHTKGQLVEPWNFGQINIEWPARMSKMGSYDEEWVRTVGTGFFDDMQPSVFNAASEDQIWTEKKALNMDETFEIWNMHPDLHCWSGTLPSLKARCFIERRDTPGQLDEMPMRPTTVWFVPHKCSYVLLFHGQLPIDEDDAYDVNAIMAGMDHMDSPRSIDDYHTIFQLRTDSEKSALHALRDRELMPADMLAPWIEKIPLDDNAVISKMRRFAESAGYPHGAFVGPIKPMSLDDLPDLVEQNDKMLEDSLEEYKQDRHADLARLDTDTSMSEFQRRLTREIYDGLDRSTERSLPHIPTSGPPDVDGMSGFLGSMQTRREMRSALGVAEVPFNKLHDAYAYGRQSLSKMYLYSVHYQDGVARVGEHRAVRLREKVLRRYRSSKNLSQMNLTGADLSNMDLSGADFSGTWLEGADFSDTNLSGAIFNEAVLARGLFLRTNLDGARLTSTNISEASFQQVSFRDAELSDLIVEVRTYFRNCHFEGTTIKDFSASDMQFEHTRFKGVKIGDVSFESSQWTQCELDQCHFDKIDINESVLHDVVISNSTMTNSVFMETRNTHVRIVSSSLTKVTFTEDEKFTDCVFEHSRFMQCLFRGVVFEKSSMQGSFFEQCDFSLASLQQCVLTNIQTPQSLFMRTNLDMADLSDSNLMTGNFQKSSFIGANLSHCNLFRADMSETLLDASTIVHNTYTQRTRVAPYRDNLRAAKRLI